MSRPTLSLLIPAYNAAKYLPRLLNSAQAQAIPFDEIWVYDDCSTDDTAAVATAYGAKVLRGDTNRGCSAGKHALAMHVETDWIHFHDADDELLPNFTTLAWRWIERNDRDVVLFAYEYRDEKSHELLSVSYFDDEALRTDARRYSLIRQINPFCGLYRRSQMLAAGGYQLDARTLYNEDSAFHIKLAFAGLLFSAESTVSIINWRISGSMSSSNQAKCAVAQSYVLQSVLNLPGSENYHQDVARGLWAVAGRLAAFSEWRHARAAAIRAHQLIRRPPEEAGKAWFRALASLSPSAALALREFAIRALRPGLRGMGK
ncbi:MAG: glycosyltransferase family 2 protein [Rubrivivax sp.]|nr:glycosyltransferase family 2 protein [Rubrivivax sp.]